MIRATPFKDRFSSALLTLVLLGLALSLFIYSFETMQQAAPQPETFLSFPRPVLRQEEPVTVIDARGIPRRAPVLPPQFTPPPAPTAPPAAITTPPVATPTPQDTVNPCAPERWAALTPEERARCQSTPAKPKSDLLTSPQLKDQQRFDAEMARKNGAAGGAGSLLVRPTPPGLAPPLDTTLGVGGAVIIKDPLCRLAVFLLGAGGCGAVAAHHQATDAQVKAAIDAANKRRGAPPPAGGQGGDGH